MQNIGIIIIAIIVLGVIFLLLREVNCWYWKINERISHTERQNLLLEKILQHISGEIPTISTNNSMRPDTEKDEIKIDPFHNNIYDNLAEQEKKEADVFINYGLKNGDRLVINKKDRNIDRFDEKEWDKIVKNLKKDEWLIIAKK